MRKGNLERDLIASGLGGLGGRLMEEGPPSGISAGTPRNLDVKRKCLATSGTGLLGTALADVFGFGGDGASTFEISRDTSRFTGRGSSGFAAS